MLPLKTLNSYRLLTKFISFSTPYSHTQTLFFWNIKKMIRISKQVRNMYKRLNKNAYRQLFKRSKKIMSLISVVFKKWPVYLAFPFWLDKNLISNNSKHNYFANFPLKFQLLFKSIHTVYLIYMATYPKIVRIYNISWSSLDPFSKIFSNFKITK